MNESAFKGERIAKVIARSGLCSRRDAEKWIEAKRVSVNGSVISSAALNVTEKDIITVDGKAISEPQEKRLWLYYKPTGLITSHKDELGRKTVFNSLPKHLPRVISVGRLDLNSEGLLLLTNDGELARYIELPATGWKRHYRVRVYGLTDMRMLDKIRGSSTIDGVQYHNVEIELEGGSQTGRNLWLHVTLTEGKNREIRKLFESIDCSVSRLIRTAYGFFQLGNMQPEELREVPRKVMLEQFGKKLLG